MTHIQYNRTAISPTPTKPKPCVIISYAITIKWDAISLQYDAIASQCSYIKFQCPAARLLLTQTAEICVGFGGKARPICVSECVCMCTQQLQMSDVNFSQFATAGK